MIIADSGFWLALLWRRERWHPLAREAYTRHAGEGFITTWPVVTEVCHLLGRSIGVEAQTAFLARIADHSIEVSPLNPPDMLRAMDLMQRYTNLPMDLADASLVILAEQLGHGRILSTDRRNFGTDRWKNRQPFENLLLGDA